ncbi:hypothetical protein [Micrococcus luteus]|uniref:hypothetical protein n=1 Tax=Micrococcus luteus TaxID=1270 RepID=UPI0037A82539
MRGHHAAVREDHLEAHHRLPGDDVVARVAGVLAEAFLTDPYTVFFLPRSRWRERLGFRETGPGAWPPRGYPRSGSDIMDLGSR